MTKIGEMPKIGETEIIIIIIIIIITNDIVYGAVIVTQSLREFTRFI